eukprot:TRINITY_DN44498_c0_g1_i1.p1 TRINITY_DN44498_c0_g1~~TRINITY_DN44498_c0_g1_i1.p1  ORF type:complete len:755 (-),score=126.51 TRINITY_DN44498_c0_g1_i1:35-2299(-)
MGPKHKAKSKPSARSSRRSPSPSNRASSKEASAAPRSKSSPTLDAEPLNQDRQSPCCSRGPGNGEELVTDNVAGSTRMSPSLRGLARCSQCEAPFDSSGEIHCRTAEGKFMCKACGESSLERKPECCNICSKGFEPGQPIFKSSDDNTFACGKCVESERAAKATRPTSCSGCSVSFAADSPIFGNDDCPNSFLCKGCADAKLIAAAALCNKCDRSLVDGARLFKSSESDSVLCEACFAATLPYCAACGKPASGSFGKLGDKLYHSDCLKCIMCGSVLEKNVAQTPFGLMCAVCCERVSSQIQDIKRLEAKGDAAAAAVIADDMKVLLAKVHVTDRHETGSKGAGSDETLPFMRQSGEQSSSPCGAISRSGAVEKAGKEEDEGRMKENEEEKGTGGNGTEDSRIPVCFGCQCEVQRGCVPTSLGCFCEGCASRIDRLQGLLRSKEPAADASELELLPAFLCREACVELLGAAFDEANFFLLRDAAKDCVPRNKLIDLAAGAEGSAWRKCAAKWKNPAEKLETAITVPPSQLVLTWDPTYVGHASSNASVSSTTYDFSDDCRVAIRSERESDVIKVMRSAEPFVRGQIGTVHLRVACSGVVGTEIVKAGDMDIGITTIQEQKRRSRLGSDNPICETEFALSTMDQRMIEMQGIQQHCCNFMFCHGDEVTITVELLKADDHDEVEPPVFPMRVDYCPEKQNGSVEFRVNGKLVFQTVIPLLAKPKKSSKKKKAGAQKGWQYHVVAAVRAPGVSLTFV